MKMQARGSRPNILLIMADQMAAPALPVYGHRVVKAPHLSALAERGVVFNRAYCNFPICAPSRYSMLTGRLPSAIDAFDNATELPACLPTLAHYLCALGYSTTLCGKMHFVGPDQLHGFEERLTTDIYPADFAWVPNWAEGPTNAPTGISMRAVVEAGSCVRSLQIDFDDETEFFGIQKLYDLARTPERRPFFLTISFSHPHSPFTASREHWDRYRHEDIDLPSVPPIAVEDMDAHSRWLYYSHGRDLFTVTEEHVRNARHAYYGMISYVDDKVGRILQTLADTGLDRNTIIVFTSDHGEMLGERGMWYKQTFFEWSARVPFIMVHPDSSQGRRVTQVVSLVDLLPTLLDLVTEGNPLEPVDPFDGASLVQLLHGQDVDWPDVAISEYTDMGVCAPCRMVRRGRHKYIYTHGNPAQLYDLENDPRELHNLAGGPDSSAVGRDLLQLVLRGWDPESVTERVLHSQKRRLFIDRVARDSGCFPNWSYVVRPDDARRFVRGAGTAGGTVTVKGRARFPSVPTATPDKTRALKTERFEP